MKHRTYIKMNQALRQAIAQIRRPSQQAVKRVNDRLQQAFKAEVVR
jgi:hypothetical protein